jgi:hypothetical protein
VSVLVVEPEQLVLCVMQCCRLVEMILEVVYLRLPASGCKEPQ